MIVDLSSLDDGLDIQTFGTAGMGHDRDLIFLLKTTGTEEIEVEAQFSSASFSTANAKLFLDHFGAALESIRQELRSTLLEIDIMSWEERQRTMFGMNAPGILSSPAKSMMELIEEQAHRTPQKIAVRTKAVPDPRSLMIFDSYNSAKSNLSPTFKWTPSLTISRVSSSCMT
jgi:hypothetical protein